MISWNSVILGQAFVDKGSWFNYAFLWRVCKFSFTAPVKSSMFENLRNSPEILCLWLNSSRENEIMKRSLIMSPFSQSKKTWHIENWKHGFEWHQHVLLKKLVSCICIEIQPLCMDRFEVIQTSKACFPLHFLLIQSNKYMS